MSTPPPRDLWDGVTSAAALSTDDSEPGVEARDDPAEHGFATSERDRYAAGSVIGTGGMGRVWSVRDARLHRSVALKELAPTPEARPELRRRLAREAWITAQLEHPGIVPVYDAGQRPDGTLFYAMRLIRGRSLQEIIENTPNLDERLTRIRHVRDACEAIAYAHAQGIIHRDLKPQNIMVGAFGETQIVDWGLARPLAEDEDTWLGAILPHDDDALTQLGSIIGTPRYMSPEQAQRQDATVASDVWSLGVLLYALLTRTTPHEGEPETLLEALRNRIPITPIRTLTPDAPPELAQIAERALQYDPSLRYESAKALADDVTAWLEGRRVDAYDYSRLELLVRGLRAWRGPLTVAAIALMLLLGLAVASYLRIQGEQQRALDAERDTRNSLRLADRNLARVLIQRSRILAASGARPEAEILAAHALAHLDSPEARGILATFSAHEQPRLLDTLYDLPEPCTRRALSSLGQALLCIERDAVSLWSTGPLELRWRVPMFRAGHGGVIDTTQRVLIQVEGADVLLDAANGATLHTWEHGRIAKGVGVFGPFAVTVVNGTVYVTDTRSGERYAHNPCGEPRYAPAVAIHPDSEQLAVYCNDNHALHLRPLRSTGPSVPHPLFIRGGITGFSYAPDGTLLAGGSSQGDAVLLDVESRTLLRQQPAELGALVHVIFSLRGDRVLLSGERGGVALWSVASGAWVGRLPSRSGVTIRASRADVLHTLSPERLERWSLPESLTPHTLQTDEEVVIGLASASLSPDGARVVANRGDGSITVFDTTSGAIIARPRFLPTPGSPIKHGDFNHDGTRYQPVAAAHEAPTLDTRTWEPVPEMTSGAAPARRVLHLGELVVLGRYVGRHQITTALWTDAPLDASLLQPILDIGPVPDERAAVLLGDGRDDNPQHVFRVDDAGELAQLFTTHGLSAVDLSSDRRTIAATSDRALLLLDASSGEELRRFETPSVLLDVVFSPDDSRVATSDVEGTLRIWDLRYGTLLAVLRGHALRAPWLDFSADGGTLFSASWDGTIQRWDLSRLEVDVPALITQLERDWGLTRDDILLTDTEP